jgi:hypothetical protein
MTSNDVDMEAMPIDELEDGISPDELYILEKTCKNSGEWYSASGNTYRKCNSASLMYPDLKLRHIACNEEARNIITMDRYPRASGGPMLRMCNFANQQNKVYPEYAKCLQPGGRNALDCQKACYVYPDQPGCEAIKAIVSGMTAAERRQKIKDIAAAEKAAERRQQIKDIAAAEKAPPPPPPAPVPEETVVIAASMRSVTPTAVQFAYVDPKTKKSVVVKKTLVDMYKPTDKVTVVLGKKTNKFIGLRKK